MKPIILYILLLCMGSVQAQKFEGLALTPPMGWNSWNTFQTNINEKLVMDIADVIASSGMKDAGYTYIVLDDGWMTMQRNAEGNLVADPLKFPHGMKALAGYIHAKGLKFGIYNCAGTKTCAGYPGTRGYEYQDARLYASWDVDYLKFDWCNTEGLNAKEAYTTMSKALRVAGRPMIFSLCEWGTYKPWEWAAPVGQLWRTTGDIHNCFECIKDHGTWKANGVCAIIDLNKDLRKYAGPGHWNDPDMMEVGNGMSSSEDRAHFSIWCMLAAPLMAGNDLRKMSTATSSTLTNKEMIAINQDKLGIQAFVYSVKDSLETWVKPMENNEVAMCFFNRSAAAKPVVFDWQKNPITDTLSKTSYPFSSSNVYQLRDAWEKKSAGTTQKPFVTTVQPHDVVVLRIKKK